MTDSTDVKLTVREAANKANAGRAILLWQVMEQLSLSGGDAPGIDDPDNTCAVAYPDQQTEFLPVDDYAWRMVGAGTGEILMIPKTTVKAATVIASRVSPGHTPDPSMWIPLPNMYDGLGIAPGVYRTGFRIAKLFDRKKRYYE